VVTMITKSTLANPALPLEFIITNLLTLEGLDWTKTKTENALRQDLD